MKKQGCASFVSMLHMKQKLRLIVYALLLQECKKPVIHSNIKNRTETCSGEKEF